MKGADAYSSYLFVENTIHFIHFRTFVYSTTTIFSSSPYGKRTNKFVGTNFDISENESCRFQENFLVIRVIIIP